MVRAALLIAAAALSASPALAAPSEVVKLPELLAAAKAICFDHADDHRAQLATATAAPYNARQERVDDDGTLVLDSPRFAVNLLHNDTRTYCMVSAITKDKASGKDGASKAKDLLGDPVVVDDSTAVWLSSTADQQPLMYGYLVLKGEKVTLASFASGVETK